jgi:arsenite transporter
MAETPNAAARSRPAMGAFERYLSLWVALCIIVGIALGHWLTAPFQLLGAMEVAKVNLPVAVLIWLMIIPMLVRIDFGALRQVKKHWRGIGVTLFINWAVKPFSMALLAWLFIAWLFAPLLPAAQIPSYIAGLIILAAAPCTAMVFVWSNLSDGEPHFTLSQVALNDVIMVFAFAPIVALLLGVTDISVPWETLLLATGLYVVIPLAAGALTRKWLIDRAGSGKDAEAAVTEFTASLKPVSVLGLLTTVVLLFGFQGNVIIGQPLLIVLIAVPLLIQSYGIFILTYAAAKVWKVPFNVAAPCALIGTSNFFELAVAVAISLFGLHSGAALATVVGVLVEVPVMLSLVAFANRTRHWFPQG